MRQKIIYVIIWILKNLIKIRLIKLIWLIKFLKVWLSILKIKVIILNYQVIIISIIELKKEDGVLQKQ
jgi:hypothetical protein